MYNNLKLWDVVIKRNFSTYGDLVIERKPISRIIDSEYYDSHIEYVVVKQLRNRLIHCELPYSDSRILLPKFQKELYRKLGNAIIKKVIDEREEAYEVFLEYRWKMKEAELNRLIEEGLISKEELEAEM